jgi:hypothetical protein
MTSKSCISFISYTALLIFFFACRTLVSDEFPEYPSSPMVNSILVQGKPITLNLSMAGKLDSLPLPNMNNADIEIWVDGIFSEKLKNTGEGAYTSSIVVEPSKTYTCKVIIPNMDTIVCSQTLPEASPILKIEHINIAGRDEEGTTYPAIKLTFPNKTGEQRYFEVFINYFVKYSAWQDEEEYVEQRSVNILTITDPVLLNEGLQIALFSNEIIQDSTYTMTLNYTTGGSGSFNGGPFRTTLFPFIVYLRSVSYDYYRYKKQYYLYQKGKTADGLLSPVTASPLYSNIENGNGIFAGYSVFATDTITPERYED